MKEQTGKDVVKKDKNPDTFKRVSRQIRNSIKSMHTFEEISPTEQRQRETSEEARLKKKMFDKLGVKDINKLQFEYPDQVFSFKDLYEFKSIMGIGGFGCVIAAQDKASKKNVALKIVIKDENDDNNINHVKMLKREAEIIEKLDHENIIKIYKLDIYQNYVVMQLKLTKESLKDFHERKRKQGQPLNESQCAQIMKGILNGLQYLHDEKNIVHRDFKPGNVLIGSYKDLSQVKIIDFGLAVENVKENISDYARSGTLLYQPPEQADSKFNYGKKADMWATGITMYEILTGMHPYIFEGGEWSNDKFIDWLGKVKKFKYPKGMSEQAKNLISRLCYPKQMQRFSAKEALRHPWITRNLEEPLPLNEYEKGEQLMLKSKLQDISKAMYFMSMVVHRISQQLTDSLIPKDYMKKIVKFSNNKKKPTQGQEGEQGEGGDQQQLIDDESDSDRQTQRSNIVISVTKSPTLLKNMEEQKVKKSKFKKSDTKMKNKATRRHRPQSIEIIDKDFYEEKKYLLQGGGTGGYMQYDDSYQPGTPGIQNSGSFQKSMIHQSNPKEFKIRGTSQAQKRGMNKVSMNLEVPDTQSKVNSYGKLSSNASQYSGNSPKELKLSNANFSDLDSSINEITNFANIENTNSPFTRVKPNAENKTERTKKLGQSGNKLPEIDGRSSIQVKNSQGTVSQPKDVLMRLREQRTITSLAQAANFRGVKNQKMGSTQEVVHHMKSQPTLQELQGRQPETPLEGSATKRTGQKSGQSQVNSAFHSVQKNVILQQPPLINHLKKTQVESGALSLKPNLFSFDLSSQLHAQGRITPSYKK